MQILVWLVIGLGGIGALWYEAREGRREECHKCQEWAKDQKGFWLRDPCEEVCEDQ